MTEMTKMTKMTGNPFYARGPVEPQYFANRRELLQFLPSGCNIKAVFHYGSGGHAQSILNRNDIFQDNEIYDYT